MPPYAHQPPAMTDLEELIKAGNDVLLEHMRPSRKVHLMPRAYSPPKLPPPPRTLSVDGNWPESFGKSIDKALNSAWADSTIKSYSHSINVFLNFCKKYHIPSEQTFPSSDYLVCAFITEQLETVSQSTIKNYVSAIRAWHIRNGYAFSCSDRLNLLTRASRPLANKNPPRPPVTIEMLLALASNLDLNSPFDACVFACATTAFWGLARLGELLPAVYNFKRNPAPFPTPASITQGSQDSLKVCLPWTKVKKWNGESIYLTIQDNGSDPVKALQQHLALNQIPDSTVLFSYKDVYGFTALLKQQFLTRCNEIWGACGLTQTSGHSFICGVHPDIIKKAGRWSSDSFLRYWRNLDTVIPKHTSRLRKQAPSGPLGEPRL